jgi:hypothetical protein
MLLKEGYAMIKILTKNFYAARKDTQLEQIYHKVGKQ